jgi:hypothetical protein
VNRLAMQMPAAVRQRRAIAAERDEKPRPAGQQQDGANQESARSRHALAGAYHGTCRAQLTDLRFKNGVILLRRFSS